MVTQVHFLDQLCKSDGQLASGTIVVLLINMQLIDIKQEVFCQGLGVS